jgi:ParB family chromosome partitioning protein
MFVLLPVGQVKAGRFQPREHIEEAALEELKASIQRQGVVEPIIVRPLHHGVYELIAGERRWRAAQAVGLTEVPAIIRPMTDQQAVEVSLIENVQRANLNPVEEAKGYGRLIEEFGYTQEDVAASVGKDRATVANTLRLLKLPEEILQWVREGALSAGHAKVLLGVDGRSRQLALANATVGRDLSVRQLEAAVAAGPGTGTRRAATVDPESATIESALRQRLGTKIRLQPGKKGGRIVIDYFSHEDLERILRALGISGA